MKKILAFLLILIIFPVQIFASPKISSILDFPKISSILDFPKISSILANPENGVENEFIEILNPTCNDINIANYSLAVGNNKFIFPEKILASNESVQFLRSETKLGLRDAGDTITLFDENGKKIDEITYAKNDVKKGKILSFSHENASCTNEEKSENNEESENKNEKNEENEEEKNEKNEENEEEKNEKSDENEEEKMKKVMKIPKIIKKKIMMKILIIFQELSFIFLGMKPIIL